MNMDKGTAGTRAGKFYTSADTSSSSTNFGLKLPQTEITVPIGNGIVGGGIAGAGLAFTVLTLGHAIASQLFSDEKRKKRSTQAFDLRKLRKRIQELREQEEQEEGLREQELRQEQELREQEEDLREHKLTNTFPWPSSARFVYSSKSPSIFASNQNPTNTLLVDNQDRATGSKLVKPITSSSGLVNHTTSNSPMNRNSLENRNSLGNQSSLVNRNIWVNRNSLVNRSSLVNHSISSSLMNQTTDSLVENLKTIFPSLGKSELAIIRKNLNMNLGKTSINSKYDLEDVLVKKYANVAGIKDLQRHVDSIFSTYSFQECQMVSHFCQLAVESGKNLTDGQRESLRSFRYGFLHSKTQKKKLFLRRMLSVATALLYATNEGCIKISRRCVSLASRNNSLHVSPFQ